MTTAPRTGPVPVVFALAYQTWADAEERQLSWSADVMVDQLARDPGVDPLVVVNGLRSHAGLLRGGATTWTSRPGYTGTQELLQPRRVRRADPARFRSTAAEYARLDRRLLSEAGRRTADRPVLVTCHPVHAAVADREGWADVVYYGWDDWAEYPPFAPRREMLLEAYRRMAERDVVVIGVTRRIVDRIGAPRSAVVPNGIHASHFEDLPEAPGWFTAIEGPVALYAGSLEVRVDREALRELAADLPDWTVVLVGHEADPRLFDELRAAPNVVVRPPEPRPRVLRMMASADVGLIPHRVTPMTEAMSPLKLYEYLASGAPVVATDLEPMRGISRRCLLVPAGAALGPRVLDAAALGRADGEEVAAFRAAHDWTARYAAWRARALGLPPG
ncbi:glycosyltransferase [Phycicoccus sp.]|uniref:glycosyltransferase n=1 Tax=Phycicoccus sp. TaxID=1902410 RepID=UPI002CC12DAD|nr:glycosyltransferase [Phycicoccus sp.]HMM93452.1 glycosyltransferase [Phycicoccus sp.]